MRLLLVSHVVPLPGSSGQQRRVADMAAALSAVSAVDLLFVGELPNAARAELSSIFRSVFATGATQSFADRLKARLKGRRHGLRPSIYQLPAQVSQWTPPTPAFWAQYDAVVFEYMHYAPVARALPVRTICDTHNILSRAPMPSLWPERLRRRRAFRYERKAWQAFDALIAINRAEQQMMAKHVGQRPVWYCPPGLDVEHWPYRWKGPKTPPRLLYYGSLSARNQQHIRFLITLMPALRTAFPDIELHLIGKGTDTLHTPDRGIIGHGFLPVSQMQRQTAGMTLALLPWEGRYGFRLRALELAALGVPIAASPDAFWGMEWTKDRHYIAMPDMKAPEEWVRRLRHLLAHPERLSAVSTQARALVTKHYTQEQTYARLTRTIHRWLQASSPASRP